MTVMDWYELTFQQLSFLPSPRNKYILYNLISSYFNQELTSNCHNFNTCCTDYNHTIYNL